METYYIPVILLSDTAFFSCKRCKALLASSSPRRVPSREVWQNFNSSCRLSTSSLQACALSSEKRLLRVMVSSIRLHAVLCSSKGSQLSHFTTLHRKLLDSTRERDGSVEDSRDACMNAKIFSSPEKLPLKNKGLNFP